MRAVNEAFETTSGVSERAIVGDPLDDYIVPDGSEELAREMNRASAAGNPIERELRRQTTDGSRWFLFRSVPFEADGHNTGTEST